MNEKKVDDVVRRHHLDALRAFAMLLGIGLHSALSFSDIPWAVQDLRRNNLFVLFFTAIHGFRMPLFMLVSGYFTMMLWRRRGLSGLLVQRFKRVFIPCMLGLVTIVPAVDWVSRVAREVSARQDARREGNSAARSELIECIREHDVEGVDRLLKEGADPDQTDPEFGIRALGWTALYGDATIARRLIEAGADVNKGDRQGHRPLHQAVFLGHAELVEILIEHGADPSARADEGDQPKDSARADLRITEMIARAIRVPLRSEDELEAGRVDSLNVLKRHGVDVGPPLVTGGKGRGWLARTRESYAKFLSSDRFQTRFTRDGEPFHLILTSIFHHLWFLWFLCWLVGLFVIAVIVAGRLSLPRFPARWIASPLTLAALIGITMVPHSLMGVFVPVFGPDTSAGVLPQPHLLLYYAIFFGFGALMYDSGEYGDRLGRRWGLWLGFAILLAFPIGLVTVGQSWVSDLAQICYAWGMSFGLIGLFRAGLARESWKIRYVSDSAYWLYLVHLPLVILLQTWVRDWEQSAVPKFLFVCGLATVLPLISYELVVRHTWLGRLLNGPRPPRGRVSRPTTE